jgi:hypothetical protein
MPNSGAKRLKKLAFINRESYYRRKQEVIRNVGENGK